MKERGKLAKDTVIGTILTNLGFIKYCEANNINFIAITHVMGLYCAEAKKNNHTFSTQQTFSKNCSYSFSSLAGNASVSPVGRRCSEALSDEITL